MRVTLIPTNPRDTYDVEIDSWSTDAKVVKRGHRYVAQVLGVDITREWAQPWTPGLTAEIRQAVEAGDITVNQGW